MGQKVPKRDCCRLPAAAAAAAAAPLRVRLPGGAAVGSGGGGEEDSRAVISFHYFFVIGYVSQVVQARVVASVVDFVCIAVGKTTKKKQCPAGGNI